MLDVSGITTTNGSVSAPNAMTKLRAKGLGDTAMMLFFASN